MNNNYYFIELKSKSIRKKSQGFFNCLKKLCKSIEREKTKTNIFAKGYYIGNPTKVKTLTLLKSPHVDKKARKQFALYVYKYTFFLATNMPLELIKEILMNKPKFIDLNIRIKRQYLQKQD